MSRLRTVVLEYEDSTRREIAFDQLGTQTRMELSALGSSQTVPREAVKTYLLLQWKDGWKEVIAAGERVTDLLRYYTIERVEEIGRVSLEVPGGAPELLLIKRLPSAIDSILLVGNEDRQAFTLQEKVTVKEGGKVEHVFYDKKRANFQRENASTAEARYAVILDSLQQELQRRGTSAAAVLADQEGEQQTVFSELARAVGLRATERQQDVRGFVQTALENLERRETKARAASGN